MTTLENQLSSQTEGKQADVLYLRMVDSAHPAGMSEVCEAAFETRGYGPLRSFHDTDEMKVAFCDYGECVCGGMLAQLQGPGLSEASEGECLALFGHAVFLNAIALQVRYSTIHLLHIACHSWLDLVHTRTHLSAYRVNNN